MTILGHARLLCRIHLVRSCSRCHSTISSVAPSLPSTVARGTAYENACLRFLARQFGMRLERVGGAGDRGIDLMGWWWLPSIGSGRIAKNDTPPPSSSSRLRVIVQCKAQNKKLGPTVIRELEGTIRAQRDLFSASFVFPEADTSNSGKSDNHSRVLGIVLSSHGFSKQSSLQCLSSNTPLLLIHLAAPPHSDNASDDTGGLARPRSLQPPDPPCFSAFGNSALLGSHGPLGGRLELRWAKNASAPPVLSDDGTTTSAGSPLFYWDRRRLDEKRAAKVFSAPSVHSSSATHAPR